ncbi:MAG: tRNA pseudouridine(55) synthase TruB [Legionellales bacterium]|nr:tRNA pseudouridine(55) synthase TruB [Legionellales bacterium]
MRKRILTNRPLRGRDINGILLLDKPIKLTSNAALQTVKRLYQAAKAGHTGSLDPLATGMLPICFGEATKFSQYLLNADKYYAVSAKLGIETDSGDADGKIIAQHHVPNFSVADIEAVLAKFRGEIKQIPSMFSAIKQQGKPLYQLAREGKEVEREARPVSVYELTLVHAGRDTLDLQVHVSKGTYVRTLVEDIGKVLGCGAHVTHLRRTRIGQFQTKQMHNIEAIEEIAKTGALTQLDSLLLSIDHVLPNWPELNLSNAAAFYLRRGQAMKIPRSPESGWVKLFHGEHQFFGIGEIDAEGKIVPRRLIKTPTVITRKIREMGEN